MSIANRPCTLRQTESLQILAPQHACRASDVQDYIKPPKTFGSVADIRQACQVRACALILLRSQCRHESIKAIQVGDLRGGSLQRSNVSLLRLIRLIRYSHDSSGANGPIRSRTVKVGGVFTTCRQFLGVVEIFVPEAFQVRPCVQLCRLQLLRIMAGRLALRHLYTKCGKQESRSDHLVTLHQGFVRVSSLSIPISGCRLLNTLRLTSFSLTRLRRFELFVRHSYEFTRQAVSALVPGLFVVALSSLSRNASPLRKHASPSSAAVEAACRRVPSGEACGSAGFRLRDRANNSLKEHAHA